MKKFVLAVLFSILTLVPTAIAQQPQALPGTPISSINAKFDQGVGTGYWPTAGSGLTLNLTAGTANCSGSIAYYSGGTLTMTASTTNYVYLNTTGGCVPAVKTSTFTSSDIPIAIVVTGGSSINTNGITDLRTMFQAPATSSGSSAGYAPSNSGSGFVLDIASGNSTCPNEAPYVYAGGTLTLTASSTNYVYLDPANNCAPAFNTQGFFPQQIPIATVVTSGSDITSVTDNRTQFVGTTSFVPSSQVSNGFGAYTFGSSPMYGGADATGCPNGLSGGAPPQDGLTSDCNFTGNLLVAAYGGHGRVFPRSIPGYTDGAYADSSALDVLGLQVLPNTDFGDSASPDSFVQIGYADADYYEGVTCTICAGTITNANLAFTAALTTTVGWLGTPHYAKIYATNTLECTQTSGTWTADNSFHSGVALSGTNSSVLTCTTPYPVTNDVIAVFKVISGGTDTATFKIDGTTVDTWNDGAAGTISTVPGSTSMWWGNRYAISSTPTTHTYTITVTAGNFTFAFFTSPQSSLAAQPMYGAGLNYPRVFLGRNPETVNAIFDNLTVSNVATLKADGWDVAAVNLDNSVPDVSLGASSFIYAGGTYPTGRVCPASTVGFPHPGDCGHLFWSWAYLSAAGKNPLGNGVGSFGPPYAPRYGAIIPQSGDYGCGQITNGVCNNASNTFLNGIQTFRSEDYTDSAVINRGVTSTPGSVPAFVQAGNQKNSSVGGDVSTTLTVTSSHTLLVMCGVNDGVGTLGVSDTESNTFVQVDYTSGDYNGFFYALGITSGSDTITCHNPSGDGGTTVIMAAEYGAAAAVTNYIWNPGVGSPYNAGPLSTAISSNLVVLLNNNDGDNPTLTTPGYTNRFTAGGNDWYIWDQTTSAGSYSIAVTFGSTPDPHQVGVMFLSLEGSTTPQQAPIVKNEYSVDGTLISGVGPSGFFFDTPFTYAQVTGYVTCNSGTEGTHAYITDSTEAITSPGSTVAGSGSNHTPIVCQYNGSSYVWVVE